MKLPSLSGLVAVLLLAAPFGLRADVQLTSFESGIDPWYYGGNYNDATTYTVTTASSTDGSSSAEAVVPMTSAVFGTLVGTPVSSYPAAMPYVTAIRADVYFQWTDKPAAASDYSSGPYYGMPLVLNYEGGFVTIDPAGPSLTENQWTTITWYLTPEQVATINDSGLGYSNIEFLLNAGTYGGATVGGTITVRIDNVVALGAPSGVPPSPASGLVAGDDLDSVSLRWTAGDQATSYIVKRSSSSGGPYAEIASGVTTTSYSDATVDAGTTYYYVVTAHNVDGDSADTSEVSGSALPAVAGGVQLTSFENGFDPWVTGDNFSSSTTYDLSTTSYTDGTTSAEAIVPMYTATYGPVFSVPVATYPRAIAAAKAIRADVYFEWENQPPTDTETGSGAYYQATIRLNYTGGSQILDITVGALKPGAWSTLTWALTPEQIATIADSGLASSNIELLLNTGVYGDAFLDGQITLRLDNVQILTEALPTPPAAPTNVAAAGGVSSISLAWTASDTATSYTVKRATTSGGPYTAIAADLTETSFVDSDVAADTTYFYVVSASNGGGEGADSTEASAALTADPLAGWRVQYFGTSDATGDAANTADPDGDGVSNLLEYALGGNPTSPDAGIAPSLSGVDGHLVLTFHLGDDPNLTYEVIAADTVDGAGTVIWTSTGAQNVAGSVSITDPELLSAHARRFLRLRVTTP